MTEGHNLRLPSCVRYTAEWVHDILCTTAQEGLYPERRRKASFRHKTCRSLDISQVLDVRRGPFLGMRFMFSKWLNPRKSLHTAHTTKKSSILRVRRGLWQPPHPYTPCSLHRIPAPLQNLFGVLHCNACFFRTAIFTAFPKPPFYAGFGFLFYTPPRLSSSNQLPHVVGAEFNTQPRSQDQPQSKRCINRHPSKKTKEKCRPRVVCTKCYSLRSGYPRLSSDF